MGIRPRLKVPEAAGSHGAVAGLEDLANGVVAQGGVARKEVRLSRSFCTCSLGMCGHARGPETHDR